MAPRGALVAAAATWAAAHGRPLSDAEMRAFYGYKCVHRHGRVPRGCAATSLATLLGGAGG